MKKKFLFLFIICTSLIFSQDSPQIDIPTEYSKEFFQKGIRAYHGTNYELAILNFLKALGYKDDNQDARYFLGEAYRKAGFDENALFVWNTQLSMGYEDRYLKNKLTYLYNKRGALTDIFIDKDFVLREDIKGYYDTKQSPLFINPAQIFVDKNNHYFIASFLTGTILEMDSNLKFVRNYLTVMPKLENPFGVTVDSSGYVYASDFKNNVILKINASNIVEKVIGFKGIGDGGLLGPKNLLLDDDENLYVSDTGNTRINKYKTNGDILFSFGTEKDGDGKLTSPCGLFYKDGRVYIADRDANRIVVFDKNGNYLFSFGEDKLDSPYDITKDKLGRLLILCKDKIWAYEDTNDLWYEINGLGNRLKRGLSITSDKESNIGITDFDSSRLFLLSLERQRYSNLNINVERVYSDNFPNVHLAVTFEKDDGTNPVEMTANNITVYENNSLVSNIGIEYTDARNEKNDICIVFDKTKNLRSYIADIKTTIDKWLGSAKQKTSFSMISAYESNPIIENDFGSSRLSILDTLNDKETASFTDKGVAIKTAIYHMLKRFSKKSLILITDGKDTGRDFEKFKIEDTIQLANNNDIKIYVLAFGDGALSETYKYITKKTGGEYYRAYKQSDIQNLIKKIETTKGKELIVSYKSKSKSRFGDEPIKIQIEAKYNGIKGIARTIYFPPKS